MSEISCTDIVCVMCPHGVRRCRPACGNCASVDPCEALVPPPPFVYLDCVRAVYHARHVSTLLGTLTLDRTVSQRESVTCRVAVSPVRRVDGPVRVTRAWSHVPGGVRVYAEMSPQACSDI